MWSLSLSLLKYLKFSIYYFGPWLTMGNLELQKAKEIITNYTMNNLRDFKGNLIPSEDGLQRTSSFLVPVGTCYLTSSYCDLEVS